MFGEDVDVVYKDGLPVVPSSCPHRPDPRSRKTCPHVLGWRCQVCEEWIEGDWPDARRQFDGKVNE